MSQNRELWDATVHFNEGQIHVVSMNKHADAFC